MSIVLRFLMLLTLSVGAVSCADSLDVSYENAVKKTGLCLQQFAVTDRQQGLIVNSGRSATAKKWRQLILTSF